MHTNSICHLIFYGVKWHICILTVAIIVHFNSKLCCYLGTFENNGGFIVHLSVIDLEYMIWINFICIFLNYGYSIHGMHIQPNYNLHNLFSCFIQCLFISTCFDKVLCTFCISPRKKILTALISNLIFLLL